MRPADWSELRYSDDTASVLRIGARNGHGFVEALNGNDGLRALLSVAEGNGPPIYNVEGPWGPDGEVVDCWTRGLDAGKLDPALKPRVVAAWHRLATSLRNNGLDAFERKVLRQTGHQLGLSAATIEKAVAPTPATSTSRQDVAPPTRGR